MGQVTLYFPAGVGWASTSDLTFEPSHDVSVKMAIGTAESPAIDSTIFKY